MSITINDLLGVPFVNGGRDLNGLDCWGLVMIVMKRLGQDFPDFNISCEDSLKINNTKSFMSNKFEVIKPNTGAIIGLYMDRSTPDLVAHFGVCLTHRRFIHTLKTHGVIVSDIYHPFFKNLIAGYYRWIKPI